MTLNADDIYELFVVKRTQVEMMYDRGYQVNDDETSLFLNEIAQIPDDQRLEEFVTRYIDSDNRFDQSFLSQEYSNLDGERIYVYFTSKTTKEKKGVDIVTDFVNIVQSYPRAVMVSDSQFTPDAKKKLASITDPIIQVFFFQQLYINPQRHFLVPAHTRLSPEEKRQVQVESRIRPTQHNTISIDDPIVRYYGWSVGDLIRIERFNLSTPRAMVQNSIAYRIVSSINFEILKKISSKKPKVVSTTLEG